MTALAKLAWRNIGRNKRRTVLTILAIMFGIWLIVVMRGLQFGSYAQMIDVAVKRGPGHLQVQRKGYWDERTIKYAFPIADADTAVIRAIPHVAHLSPKLAIDALVGAGEENTTGARVVGIIPSLERAMTLFAKGAMVRGEYLADSDTTYALIGETMASNLRANVGDKLVIFTQARDGSIGAALLTIKGIYHTGERGMDAFTVLCHLAEMQDMLVAPARATAIALTVDDVRNIAGVKAALDEQFHVGDPASGWDVLTYKRLLPALTQSIAFDNATGVIFLILLLIVIAFGILNTILMSAIERFHEFGIMMALGMKPRKIAALVFFESSYLSLAGLFVGNLLGYLTNAWWRANPTYLKTAKEAYENYGFAPVLVAVPDLSQQAVWSLVVVVLTFVVAMWPAWVAMRFRPVEAIRQV